jgi:N-acetylneuraminic acid mutarotase
MFISLFKLSIVKNNLTKYLLIAAIINCTLLLSCKKEVEKISSVTGNRRPVANAGADIRIASPNYPLNLDGTASSDPDKNIQTYQWRRIYGPSEVKFKDSNAVRTEVINFISGTYRFELKVTDAGDLSSLDTVEAIVLAPYIPCGTDRAIVQARLVPLTRLSFTKVEIITATVDNKIFFAGGSGTNRDDDALPIHRIDIYDINSNSMSTKDLDPYPTARLDMGIAATQNKIFIAGGGFWGDDLYTGQVDIYNAEDNRWSTAWLSEGRTAAAGISAGNKVFFAGGYSYNGGNYWSNTVDIYDDATDTWTTSTLSERRGYISAVASGNKVYFAGGEKNDGNYLTSNRIDEYDLSTDTWSTSSLREPGARIGSIAVDNKVYFAGGISGAGESGTVEIKDVATGATSYNCIIPRYGLSAVLKDNTIVFFTGDGIDPRNGTHFEIYDLTTKTWKTAVLDKSITRAGIISVNNVIYVAGGFVNGVGSDQVWKLEF